MALNLIKGERVQLTKGRNIKSIKVALGWEPKDTVGGADFDPDVSAFLINAAGKCLDDQDVVFYNMKQTNGKLMHYSGAVLHTGDNRTGVGVAASDKEVIQVDLTKVPAMYTKIAFVVTIYDAETRKQNLGMIRDAFIRVVDDFGAEVLRYNLTEDFSTQTAVVVAEVYRDGNEWKFAAVGTGFAGGLAAIMNRYGITI